MRPRLALLIVLLLAPLAVLGPIPVSAQPTQPLDRLLPEIRRAYPGQFLDAEPSAGENGSPGYRLKWLTPDGRVLWLDADARTGRVTRQAPDRGANRRDDAARSEAPPPPPPRGNFRESGDSGGFANRGFGPRTQYAPRPQDDGQPDRFGSRGFGRPQFEGQQDRFNRSPEGGFGNRGERFGGRGFGGGDGGESRGRFGGGRARGRD